MLPAHGPVRMSTEALLLRAGIAIVMEWKLIFPHRFPWALPCTMVPHGSTLYYDASWLLLLHFAMEAP